MAVFAGTLWWVEAIQRTYPENQGQGWGRARAGQGLIPAGGCIAGGVLNPVSPGLSLFGLQRLPQGPAIAGAMLSLVGPALVVGWWLMVVVPRMAPGTPQFPRSALCRRRRRGYTPSAH